MVTLSVRNERIHLVRRRALSYLHFGSQVPANATLLVQFMPVCIRLREELGEFNTRWQYLRTDSSENTVVY